MRLASLILLLAACAAENADKVDDTAPADTEGDSTPDAASDCELPPFEDSESGRPIVLGSCPENGDTAVDPSITRVRARFSRAMADGSWSFVQFNDNYPDTLDNPRFTGGATIVADVALEAGTTYELMLNSEPDFLGFESIDGKPAVPFTWTFTTANE